MHKYIIIFLFFLLLNGQYLQARTRQMYSIQDLVKKMDTHHPDLIQLRMQQKQLQADMRTAREIPNPELNTKVLSGTDQFAPGGEYSLMQSIRLGGKSQALIKHASVRQKLFRANYQLARLNKTKELILLIRRIQQITEELANIDESIATFRRLVENYRRLPRLSPNKKTVQDLYISLISENTMTQNALRNKRNEMVSRLQFIIGVKNISHADIKPLRLQWPKKQAWQGRGPLLKMAELDINQAQAQLNMTLSRMWPDLKVGPVLQHDPGGGASSLQTGFAFSINLPLYHRNNGIHEKAKYILQWKQKQLLIVRRRVHLMHSSMRQSYQSTRALLLSIQKKLQDQTQHKRLHIYIRRGLIDPSIIIEVHRQHLSLLRTYHQNEMRALSLLCSLHSLEGKIYIGENNEQ